MLEFYYDFIDKFVDRSDFQYLEMDTDSAYIGISGESLEEVIRPELREQFQEEKHLWLPRNDTPENRAYDKRTPGLFKVEFEGNGFISLCSKTYYCFGRKDKYSCKGIIKKCNDINKETFLKVLTSRKSASGVNRGFRCINNRVYTYSQVRQGFSFFMQRERFYKMEFQHFRSILKVRCRKKL